MQTLEVKNISLSKHLIHFGELIPTTKSFENGVHSKWWRLKMQWVII